MMREICVFFFFFFYVKLVYPASKLSQKCHPPVTKRQLVWSGFNRLDLQSHCLSVQSHGGLWAYARYYGAHGGWTTWMGCQSTAGDSHWESQRHHVKSNHCGGKSMNTGRMSKLRPHGTGGRIQTPRHRGVKQQHLILSHRALPWGASHHTDIQGAITAVTSSAELQSYEAPSSGSDLITMVLHSLHPIH